MNLRGRVLGRFCLIIETNMSDAPKLLAREYENKVVVTEPEFKYAAKQLEFNPIFALQIPFPLFRNWHKLISVNNSYTYATLLEHAIPCQIFAFTDNVEKRMNIDVHLSKLAGSVAQMYRTTRGRKRLELDSRVKKFHVLANHIKTPEETQRQINALENDINEWKSQCKNLEEEKKQLFNEMVDTINKKDIVISLLQTTNSELENYILNLENAAGLQAPYKGKFTSSSQNKSRTLKSFLTRAETALWFSKSFGLDIQSILVKESDTEVNHTLHFDKENAQPDTSSCSPPENQSKFSTLPDEDKKQIEEILYLLDKFCVGDSFYHEVTMVTNGLPKAYLIHQCRSELNNLCHITSLPGKHPGAQVKSIKDIIQDHIQDYLQSNPGFDLTHNKIQIKISGDGARMTRNSSFILLSFSILQTGENVMSAKGNRTIAVVNAKEEYDTLKESFGCIFKEINTMISEGKMTVDDQEVNTEFFLGGDYKYILLMLGLNAATGNYACAWCKIHKLDRWKMNEGYQHFNRSPLARSLDEIKEMSKKSTDNYGCRKEPLLNIELDHILVDELHMLLRVTDVLTANLVGEVMDWDKEDEFDQAGGKRQIKGVHLNKLIDSIRSCGVSFEVWEKRNADGKGSGTYDWTSLMGSDKKTLIEELPDKMIEFLKPETAELVIKLWKDFNILYKHASNWLPETGPMEFWLLSKHWIDSFVFLGGKREGYERKRVTPYMHIMAAHIPHFLGLYINIKMFTGQGVEKNNDVARSIVLRKSNKWDAVGDVLKHESRQWLLQHRERETRPYKKRKAQYWDTDIRKKKKKSMIHPNEENCQNMANEGESTSTRVTANSSTPNNTNNNFIKMTVPELKKELKNRGIKGFSNKCKKDLLLMLQSSVVVQCNTHVQCI